MTTSRFESYQKGLLGAEAFGHTPVSNPLEHVTPIEKALCLVYGYVKARLEKTDTHVTFEDKDVYVVSFMYILGGWKAMISTSLPDGMYYEVTYAKNKKETYIDAYKKFDNVCVPDES